MMGRLAISPKLRREAESPGRRMLRLFVIAERSAAEPHAFQGRIGSI
jgi:hypothetical protein